MDEKLEIRYEIIATFGTGTKMEWECNTLQEAKTQYELVKKYKGLKEIECNQITTEKVNLF